jgi:hypothetical protein
MVPPEHVSGLEGVSSGKHRTITGLRDGLRDDNGADGYPSNTLVRLKMVSRIDRAATITPPPGTFDTSFLSSLFVYHTFVFFHVNMSPY